MGILKDPQYWGRVISRIEERRALTRGDVMPREDAVAVMQEACRAFSDLVEDPDFEADLRECVEVGRRATQGMPREGEEFERFVQRFRDVEEEVLRQSGVNEGATIHVADELSGLLGVIDDFDFDRVEGKIRLIRDVCCRYAKDPEFAQNPQPELAEDALEALKGIAIVGVDIGIMTQTGEVGDTFIGMSVGVGLNKCRALLRRMW